MPVFAISMLLWGDSVAIEAAGAIAMGLSVGAVLGGDPDFQGRGSGQSLIRSPTSAKQWISHGSTIHSGHSTSNHASTWPQWIGSVR